MVACTMLKWMLNRLIILQRLQKRFYDLYFKFAFHSIVGQFSNKNTSFNFPFYCYFVVYNQYYFQFLACHRFACAITVFVSGYIFHTLHEVRESWCFMARFIAFQLTWSKKNDEFSYPTFSILFSISLLIFLPNFI